MRSAQKRTIEDTWLYIGSLLASCLRTDGREGARPATVVVQRAEKIGLPPKERHARTAKTI